MYNDKESYRFNVDSITNAPVNGIMSTDIQGLNPNIIGKRCEVTWQRLSLQTSSSIVSAVGMVADGIGTDATTIVVKTKLTPVIGPIGTTGFLTIAGAGNSSVAFTVHSSTQITLATDQTWVDEAAVSIDSITNGGDEALKDYPFLSVRTNLPDKVGNTELLNVDFNQICSFDNNFDVITTSNDGSYSYYESIVPSRLEVHLTTNLQGTQVLKTTNPFRIQLCIHVLD